MTADKWVVRVFGPAYIGMIFVPTRKEGRRLVKMLKFAGYGAWVGSTGL